MYLPGTIHERIGDLRSSRGLSQRKLSEMTGIGTSQLSRIENGEIKNISSDILIKLAKAFGVSTDYILGLTTISIPKNYNVSELGLTEGAIKAIVTGAADAQLVNRLIEHKNFWYLQQLIDTYIYNTAVDGIRARNEMIDIVTSSLGDYMKAHPEQRKTIQGDIRNYKSQKLGEHEAELEKIKSTFLAILKDIKNDIDAGDPPRTAATDEILQQMRTFLKEVVQSPRKYKANDVAKMVTEMFQKAKPLDDEGAEMLERLAEKMLLTE